MPRTFNRGLLDPKGHPLPDNFRELSRLRDRANRARRKSKRKTAIVKAATKIFGGLE